VWSTWVRPYEFVTGVAGAKAGTLTFLVGGPSSSYNLALPTLSHMGARITHVGPSGAGLGAKIVNNLILGAQQLIVGEGMLLGERLGLDPAILADVVNSSTGGCWSSRVNNPVKGALREASPPCERDYEGGFATALMLKVRFHSLLMPQSSYSLRFSGYATCHRTSQWE
jgi:3-hydroxyisobutyrate dehydrogenase